MPDRTGEAAGTWIILHAQEGSHEEIINRALKELRLKYGHFWFAHPRKREFVRKFGICYLELRDKLKKDEDLNFEDKKKLATLVSEPEYLDYAIAALQVYDPH